MDYKNKKELVEKIKSNIMNNKNLEEIYTELISYGYKVKDINDAFKIIDQEENKISTQNYAVITIVTLGALLVGVGIISFIAANWNEMSKLSRLFLLLFLMVSAYVLSWYFEEKLSYIRVAKALLLLGSIIFGATIFLVGQMYHVRGNWPDAFILWFLGIIAMALAKDMFELYLLAILIAYFNVLAYPYFVYNVIYVEGIKDYFNFTPTWLVLLASLIAFALGIYFQYKFASSNYDNNSSSN